MEKKKFENIFTQKNHLFYNKVAILMQEVNKFPFQKLYWVNWLLWKNLEPGPLSNTTDLKKKIQFWMDCKPE